MLLACLALAPVVARAEHSFSFRFTSGRKEVKRAHKALDKWLRTLSKREFPGKMAVIARSQAISRAQFGVPDMRDALAALPSTGGASASGRSVKASRVVPCSSLETCPARIGTAHAETVSGLSDAVISVVRPWLLLQHRRGGGLSLRSDAGEPGVLATMSLDRLVSSPIDICASPAPLGGLDVWLRSAADLDDIYAFSREEIGRAHV